LPTIKHRNNKYGWSKTALAVLQAIAKAIALRFFKQLVLNFMALGWDFKIKVVQLIFLDVP